MYKIDQDLDTQLHQLEREWRSGYEASIAARADYQRLAADPATAADVLDQARERLERAEAAKARVMVRIERVEGALLGQD